VDDRSHDGFDGYSHRSHGGYEDQVLYTEAP